MSDAMFSIFNMFNRFTLLRFFSHRPLILSLYQRVWGLFLTAGLWTIFFPVFSSANLSAAEPGRFSEIVLTFKTARQIHITEDQEELALILEFRNTSQEELQSLYRYDDSVIRRILIREQGSEGTEVHIYLKDKNLKAVTDLLDEPFRLSISIFDKHYSQLSDPMTGLPEVLSRTENSAGQPAQRSDRDATPHQIENIDNNKKIWFQYAAFDKQADRSGPVKSHQPAKHKLLQPTLGQTADQKKLSEFLQNIPDGRGSAWSTYPYYIYPTQTAPYEGRKRLVRSADGDGGRKADRMQGNTDNTEKSFDLVEYAYKMYSFGNENKALAAYQQALHLNPIIFEQDVLHLWAFAESHLGQGNLSLADGYFEALINKFPESPLSKMAYLRRLDIQSVRMLRSKKPEDLASLTLPLQKMDTLGLGELSAQKAIRIAYWLPPIPENYRTILPLTSKENAESLKSSFPQAESRKTAFLSTAIIIKNFLHPDTPWSESGAALTTNWLEKYTSTPDNPFYKTLEDEFYSKLSEAIISNSEKSNFLSTVQIWNSLPEKIRDIQKNPAVSWSVGEAFRNLHQDEVSLPFYKTASAALQKGPDKFRASFWLAVLSGRVLINNDQHLNEKSTVGFKKQSEQADVQSLRIWSSLTDDEKNHLRATYQDHFQATLDDEFNLKTPAIILLETWENALGSSDKAKSPESDAGSSAIAYLPEAKLVRLLQKLIEKFRKASLTDERRRAVRLLKQLKPEKFKDDNGALEIWNNELSDLADEYRESGEYLKAGRLFAFTAENSYDWSNRAESLYKGGLLLYRAGKREEAITALTKASQDGNNLFYANLAKERLTQLLP